MSRRGWLQNVGVVGAVAALPLGCDDDAGADPSPSRTFEHGVASGDPLPDAVVLWTRVTPDAGRASAGAVAEIEVTWELSTSREFAAIEASGKATTDAARDFTVKVDARGLKPGTTYYYRFRALGQGSPRGRTRTAPAGATERLRFGVVSCSSYGHGWFHAYRDLAKRLELDAIVHLGDYIYEYGNDGYGDARQYEPAGEIVTLADYRRRYSQYRRDADLRELHRQFPFITVWDDHETTNNAWRDGAQNHDASEGAYEERRKAAAQAYAEWMPIRIQENGAIYRALAFGDLVDLVMLDTRIVGRDEQGERRTDPAILVETRQLLGLEQENFLRDRMRRSTARWTVLGQQVVMAPFLTFFNTDAWDGYPAARERVYRMIEENPGKDVVVLTGDVHMSFGLDVVRDPKGADYDPKAGKGGLAVEFVVPGVTSPGFPEQLSSAAKGMLKDNPHCRFANVHSRGYLVLDVTRERVQGAWFHYTAPEEQDVTPEFGGACSVTRGRRALVVDERAVDPPTDPPPAA